MLRIALLAALLVPGSAAAAEPVAGARYADTDFAFWADLRVSKSGGSVNGRIENLTGCPGPDLRFKRARIDRRGRFRVVRRRGRYVLRVAGRFRTREAARIGFRWRRVPLRRGRDCDSGGTTLAPRRVVPLGSVDCRTHEAPTILATSAGRVFRHAAWGGRDGWGTATYGCLFSAGRPVRLGKDDDDDSDLDRFRLVEPYVAFEHSECSMGCFYSVHVVDLRDGTVRHLPREPAGPFGQVADLELRETGSAAWIARPAQYSTETQPSVWADDGSATTRLDTGAIELESLELNGSALTWMRDGVPRSATLD